MSGPETTAYARSSARRRPYSRAVPVLERRQTQCLAIGQMTPDELLLQDVERAHVEVAEEMGEKAGFLRKTRNADQ